MNIDYLLNGTKKKKPSKDLADLMINLNSRTLFPKERKFPIGMGRQTKAQKKVKRKDFFGDWDKDGVINRLDCAPRNKKKHYWDLSQAKKEGQYVTYMTPQEYLEKTDALDKRGQPRRFLQTYTDMNVKDKEGYYKSVPIKKLSQHIQGYTPVNVPWLKKDNSHEGRHRAYAAQLAGQSVIPVGVEHPREHLTQEIAEKFVQKRFGNAPRELDKWKTRFEKDPTPLFDIQSRKTFKQTLREQGHEPEGPATIEEDD